MATEQLNTVIESEIGGSPICEAVKKMADVLFETVIKPEYENDIINDEQEGGEYLDSSMATDADRMQDKYGTSMSVVDAKDILTMPEDDLSDAGDKRNYSNSADTDDLLAELEPYMTTNKVSEEDKRQLVSEVAERVYRYFKDKAWEDPEVDESVIQEYLNAYKCSYEDFMTVKSFIDNNSAEDLAELLFNVVKMRIRTIPLTFHVLRPKNNAFLYRKQGLPSPKTNYQEVTVNAPALRITQSPANDEGTEFIILKRIAECIDQLMEVRVLSDGRSTVNSDALAEIVNASKSDVCDSDLYELVFACVIPQLAKILEPEEADASDEEDEYDDSMSPGNKTPENAYSDFDEVSERSIIDSVGTKLPGDIYNPTLIEAVDHISEALFEG